MKKLFAIILSLVMIISGVWFGEPAARISTAAEAEKPLGVSEKNKDYVRGEALVSLRLKKGEDSELIHEGALRSDPTVRVRRVMRFGKDFYIALVKSDRFSAESLKNRFKRYRNVEAATKNERRKVYKFSATNDPLFDWQWSLGGANFFGDNSYYPAGVDIGYKPETEAPTEKNTPVVAVVDDGVDYELEDLRNKMWVNPFSKSKLPGKHGYDCYNDDDDPMPSNPDDTHGTNIASIIAAETDNGIGTAGVSRYAKIMPLKIFEGGSFSYAAELMAYEYIYKALKLGVNIVAVNCSYGSTPSPVRNEEDDDVVKMVDSIVGKCGKLGAVFAYAVGNNGMNVDENPYGTPYQQKGKYIIRVGASNCNGGVASFSNYGKIRTDIFAPGENILALQRTPCFQPNIFTPEQKKDLCIVNESFDSNETKLLTIDQVMGKQKSYLTVEHSDRDFYGSKTSGSVKVHFKKLNAPSSDSYCLYYDITDYAINPDDDMYVYYDTTYHIDDNGDAEWDPQSARYRRKQFLSLFTYQSRNYLRIDLRKNGEELGDKVGKDVLIDNLTISRNIPDDSVFDKYDYVDGTSFSTPIVAGVLARLAVQYPGDDAVARKARLLSCVKKLPAFEDKCVVGGILNLNALESA